MRYIGDREGRQVFRGSPGGFLTRRLVGRLTIEVKVTQSGTHEDSRVCPIGHAIREVPIGRGDSVTWVLSGISRMAALPNRGERLGRFYRDESVVANGSQFVVVVGRL